MISDKIQEEIYELCLEGLMTDGGHHKQWFLEQILKKIGFNIENLREKLESTKDEDGNEYGYSWDEGIAP